MGACEAALRLDQKQWIIKDVIKIIIFIFHKNKHLLLWQDTEHETSFALRQKIVSFVLLSNQKKKKNIYRPFAKNKKKASESCEQKFNI